MQFSTNDIPMSTVRFTFLTSFYSSICLEDLRMIGSLLPKFNLRLYQVDMIINYSFSFEHEMTENCAAGALKCLSQSPVGMAPHSDVHRGAVGRTEFPETELLNVRYLHPHG